MASPRRFRLNRKLIVVTLLLAGTGGAGVLFAHRAQVSAMVESSRGIGLAAAENKNWHEAVAHLKLYLQHHPKDKEALTACADALARGYNELENAFKLYEQALEIEPNRASYLDTYGWVFFQQEKYGEAVQWLKKAVESAQPASAAMLEHYGDALYKSGDRDGAEAQWKRAQEAGADHLDISAKLRNL